jgi:hypothetical protein
VVAVAATVATAGLPAAAHAEATSLSADDGPATYMATVPAEQVVTIGDKAVFEVTVDGNRQAGKLAHVVVYVDKDPTDDVAAVPVATWDPVMTTQPQTRTFELDTSESWGGVYIYDIDVEDVGCFGAGFSFVVLPDLTTPPVISEAAVRVGKVPGQVRAGARVSVPGRTIADGGYVSGRKVVLQVKGDRGWRTVRGTTVRTSAKGTFTLRTPKLRPGVHRFRAWVPEKELASKARTVRAVRR